MKILNMGILAHVDAGKTSLTERILFETGVIDAPGTVDSGTTRTDSTQLERRRGITIESAVVSFPIGDLSVNLVDTPGHSDFIAEVERTLGILDGAVLVVSAVEGVQAHTKALMRTLTELGIPTLVFVNKIDRTGARPHATLRAVQQRLSPHSVAVCAVKDPGTPHAAVRAQSWHDSEGAFLDRVAETVAENDDSLLEAYLNDDRVLDGPELRHALTSQARRALAHPVLFGSAATGAGVPELLDALGRYLPVSTESGGEGLRGTIFKVERGASGEKICSVRIFTGTIAARQRLSFRHPDGGTEGTGDGRPRTGRVTAIRAFENGALVDVARLGAGGVAKVWGLREARAGDWLGGSDTAPNRRFFAPPTLETVVEPVRPGGEAELFAALRELAERDPLIGVRRDGPRAEVSVRLYGDVQREVLGERLRDSFGVEARLHPTRPVYVERLVGVGTARQEIDPRGVNHLWATIGLRVEPGPVRSGIRFAFEVESGSLPAAFFTAIEESARAALGSGIHGWPVPDCVVTLTRSGYASPVSTADDFRQLTRLLMAEALAEAGTTVHEPVHTVDVEAPADAVGAVLAKLADVRAAVGEVAPVLAEPGTYLVKAVIPAAGLRDLERFLPGPTHGEGVLVARFHGYRRVSGDPPVRDGERGGW